MKRDYKKMWNDLKCELYYGHPLYASAKGVCERIVAEMINMEAGGKFGKR